MALEYKSQVGLEAIMPVLDEYVLWYGRLVKSYFEGKVPKELPPAVFSEWLSKARTVNSLSHQTAERVERIHADMLIAANKFSAMCNVKGQLPLKEYNDLNGHYEEFIQILRRIELDQAHENSGFNEKTGLRSAKLMHDDFDREMERRARRGNPFSLGLVKINDFRDEWRGDEKLCRGMIRKVSDQIRLCLRSFDDAYYMGDEYFILALKHADGLGSQSAVNRLNQAITTAHVAAPDDPMREISLSSIVFEPTPGDSLDDLLENMKKDLEGIEDKGTVLQYNDISPLQRYIDSVTKK